MECSEPQAERSGFVAATRAPRCKQVADQTSWLLLFTSFWRRKMADDEDFLWERQVSRRYIKTAAVMMARRAGPRGVGCASPLSCLSRPAAHTPNLPLLLTDLEPVPSGRARGAVPAPQSRAAPVSHALPCGLSSHCLEGGQGTCLVPQFAAVGARQTHALKRKAAFHFRTNRFFPCFQGPQAPEHHDD